MKKLVRESMQKFSFLTPMRPWLNIKIVIYPEYTILALKCYQNVHSEWFQNLFKFHPGMLRTVQENDQHLLSADPVPLAIIKSLKVV